MVGATNTGVAATTKTVAQRSVTTVKLPVTMPATTVPVHYSEKPEKFIGLNFKRWQQKMFYLTTLNLARFLIEKPPKLSEGERNMQWSTLLMHGSILISCA